MFGVIEKNQKLVRTILILVTATFVLWGIGGYLGMLSDDGYLAKVGGKKIYQRDLDNAMEQNPQNTDKAQVLFGLINRQLLLNNIEDNYMQATNTQLQQQIGSIPAFQKDGKFDLKAYEDYLGNTLQTSSQFQQQVSDQIMLNQMVDFFKSSYFSSKLFRDKLAVLLSRERQVSSYSINSKDFYSKINISDKEVHNYYVANQANFAVPARVKVSYIKLDQNAAANNIKVSESEIKQYIASNSAKLSNQEIDASHILFTVPKDADSAIVQKIKLEAQKVLEQVRAHPDQFAKLAKQYSQDPGSANNGGDLGFFGRGAMVKPFEDAAFGLKVGQVSNLVRTQYGFHIIKLNAIKGGGQNLDELAKSQLQKQKAVGQLQKMVNDINDIIYGQPKSLQGVSQRYNLPIQTSDWIVQNQGVGEFANPNLQKAIFNPDAVVQGNNTQLVDVGNSIYIAARVANYEKAYTPTETQLKDKIIEQLKMQQAMQMAAKQGQDEINRLNSGKLKLNFTNVQDVNLLGQNAQINQMMVKQIFAIPANKLPSYTSGVNDQGMFIIYKVISENIDPKLNQQNDKILDQLSDSGSMLDFSVYMQWLRSKYDVTYRLDRLNLPKQQPTQ